MDSRPSSLRELRPQGLSLIHIWLTVEDDGVGAAGTQEGSAPAGHGIEGMAERAHLLGGTLEAAPRFGGGFRVTAVLPVPERGEAQ